VFLEHHHMCLPQITSFPLNKDYKNGSYAVHHLLLMLFLFLL